MSTIPLQDRDAIVTACGHLCVHRKKINNSTVKAGQRRGIKEIDDGIWLVTFNTYDLGYIDLEQRTLEPIEDLLGPIALPMPQVRSVAVSSGQWPKN